jgi:hypothetical protein
MEGTKRKREERRIGGGSKISFMMEKQCVNAKDIVDILKASSRSCTECWKSYYTVTKKRDYV